MIPQPPKNWPPIIDHKAMPPALVWRDLICTIAMWGGLAWLCRRSIHAVLTGLYHLFRPEAFELPDLDSGWAVLRPYLIAALLLGIWILIWGLVTLRRRERALHLPKPPPLHLREEAQSNHCTVAEILEWRRRHICVVDFTGDGHPRVRPPV